MLSRLSRSIRDSSFYDRITTSSIFRTALFTSDTLAALGAKLVPATEDDYGHILMAPTGGGNIGDQALFESFLANTTGPVTVLATGPNSLIVPNEDMNRIRIESSFGVMYAPPLFRIPSVFRIARMIRRSHSVSVMGADLMDGLYNPAASLSRISILKMGATFGKPTVLVGCSWADNALPTCAVGLKRAGDAGAKVNARDKFSHTRMIRDGIDSAELVADLVFALGESEKGTPVDAFIESQRSLGQKIGIVNLSGLVGQKIDQIPEYIDIVNYLLKSNYSVILLPHVFRATGDDLEACRDLNSRFADERIKLVNEQLRPRVIRALCRQSDAVITGRMHLAVMAMSERRIPITLSTHGKVEGMYAHFGDIDHSVDPIPGFGKKIIDKLTRVDHESIDWDFYNKQVFDLARKNIIAFQVETGAEVEA